MSSIQYILQLRFSSTCCFWQISQHLPLLLYCKWDIHHFSFHLHYHSYLSSCERSFMAVRCLYCTSLTWLGGGIVVQNSNHDSENVINCKTRKGLELPGNKYFFCAWNTGKGWFIQNTQLISACNSWTNEWKQMELASEALPVNASTYFAQVICHSHNRWCWVALILNTRIIATLHYRIIS
jgi:hypothetical protein